MVDPILKHFKANDKVMAQLFGMVLKSGVPLEKNEQKPTESYAEALFSSIVSQQLSTKAAATIWQRFVELVKQPGSPDVVKQFDVEKLRSVGLSRSKAQYILAIAEGTSSGTVRLDHLADLEDEAVIAELVQLKGIGRWTAEMFLIFTLGRPDVFSLGDLGLRKAAEKLYGRELTPIELIEISKTWSPYRSTASLLLWHSLDN